MNELEDEEFLRLMQRPKHELARLVLDVTLTLGRTLEKSEKNAIKAAADTTEVVRVLKIRNSDLFWKERETWKRLNETIKKVRKKSRDRLAKMKALKEQNQQLKLELKQAQALGNNPNPFGGGVLPTPSAFEPRYKAGD
jgi:ATP phosphoribosyltransferase